MKISWSWLQRWVDLQGLTPEQVMHGLTMAGLEGEGLERKGHGCEQIVVARIDAIEPHPRADKLVVCRVDVGQGELRQIVCGAKNMKAGDLVPAALPGSQPPSLGFVIGERAMMGVASQGMLCSEDELGLSAQRAEGLLILPEQLPLGQPIFEALGLKDTILEIGLTPNRADCLSHRGVAREVAAAFKRPLKTPEEATRTPAWVGSGGESAQALCGLDVQDAQGCPRYAFAIIEGVRVGPSPPWLKQALVSVGLRSVNNLVDVTNYVLMDVGQPLHAFDLDMLQGPLLQVRRARAGESLLALDHKTYALDEADLVIADASGPVALAGVMGGQRAEVSEATTRVLIECAGFDPSTVRKSARRHGLHTDSSHRFERGVDPAALMRCLQRAVALMLKTQEGLDGAQPVVAEGIGWHEPSPALPVQIKLPFGMPNARLGTQLERQQVCDALESIGLLCRCEQDHHRVTAPTWRPDLERPIDLVEEIARLIGYDAIPSSQPKAVMGQPHARRAQPKHAPTIPGRERLALGGQLRQLLLSHGLYETLSYSFMGQAQLDELLVPEQDPLREQAVAVANPMNPDQAMMRTTMATSLVSVLKHNWAQRVQDVAIFEIGRCYWRGGEEAAAGLLLAGRSVDHWSSPQRAWDFYDAKGLVEAMGRLAGVSAARWQVPSALMSFLHPGVQAVWLDAQGQPLAWVGQLHPAVGQAIEIERPVFMAQVWLERVVNAGQRALPVFKPLSRFPAVRRDFALVQEATQPFAALEDALLALRARDEALGALMESYRVFDVYQGERLEAGKRSVALEVVLRASDRTLTDEEIAAHSASIIEALTQQTGATLR